MGCLDLLAPPNTLNAKLAHQTFDRAAGNTNLLAPHRMPQLARAIDRPVLLPNVRHLLVQIRIPLGAIRSPGQDRVLWQGVRSKWMGRFAERGRSARPRDHFGDLG